MFAALLSQVLMFAINKLVKNSKNTIDDKMVEAMKLALKGEDYGLQRKAKGPRKNKRVANGEKK